MKSFLRLSGVFLLAPLLSASAQTMFYVEHHGRMLPACAAKDIRPMVSVDGRLVPAEGRKFAMKSVDDYAPAIVDILDLSLGSGGIVIHDEPRDTTLKTKVALYAEMVSGVRLENVFLVLELDSENAGKNYLVQEVGVLEPNRPKTIRASVRTDRDLGKAHYTAHLYTGGRELLHTKMPASQVASYLDNLVARLAKKQSDAAPRRLIAPEPKYPEPLAHSGQTGHVTLKFDISTDGTVNGASIVDASAPEFGTAALAAVQTWRFVPRVVAGTATSTTVTLPLTFEPPEQPASAPSHS